MTRLLFISPVLPDRNGGGREKRAHLWISSLKKEYDVTVLVIERGCQTRLSGPDAKFMIFTAGYTLKEKIGHIFRFFAAFVMGKLTGIFFWNPLTTNHRRALRDTFQGLDFEKIICFRLYLSEYALFLRELTKAPIVELDLDDVESSTWKSIAGILFKDGYFKRALFHWITSVQFFVNERRAVRKFDSVYVCCDEDRSLLKRRFDGADIRVFANKIHGYPSASGEWLKTPRSFLFTGSLGYYPNEEALRWFIKNVFRVLRAEDPGLHLNVVGFNPNSRLSGMLAKEQGVNFYKNIPSVESIYKMSHISISPLHAGGGTKLKVLEAMSFGLPVVATKESARGLDLEPGIHFLQADTPGDFIAACKLLLHDGRLYQEIASNGRRHVAEQFCYGEV